MKKIFSICTIALVGMMSLSLFSCDNQDNKEEVTPVGDEIKGLRFDIEVINESNHGTKAVKTDWEEGDKILVFFNVTTQPSSMYETGFLDSYRYVTLTFDGSDWNGTFSSSNSEDYKRLGTSGTMYAVYFPFGNVTRTANGFRTSNHTNGALNDLMAFSYYLIDESGSPYTMTLGEMATLSGTLHMSLPDNFVYFYIDKQGDNFNQNEKYRLSVEGVKPATVKLWDGANGFSKDELGAGQPMWGYKYGDGIAFAGILDESWDTPADHKLIFFSDGDPAKTKTMKNVKLSSHESVKLKNPFDAANGWKQVMTVPKTYTEMGAGGLKWGNCNLGDGNGLLDNYGTAFRWGEIVSYSGECYVSRYTAKNLTGNYAIYDVARAYLGSDWRMPTKAEFSEMMEGSTASYSTGGAVTGGPFTHKGIIYTSNTDPTNSIYFPYNGDSNGWYWSSTARSSDAYAYYTFASKKLSEYGSGVSTACAIRPIYIGE